MSDLLSALLQALLFVLSAGLFGWLLRWTGGRDDDAIPPHVRQRGDYDA